MPANQREGLGGPTGVLGKQSRTAEVSGKATTAANHAPETGKQDTTFFFRDVRKKKITQKGKEKLQTTAPSSGQGSRKNVNNCLFKEKE